MTDFKDKIPTFTSTAKGKYEKIDISVTAEAYDSPITINVEPPMYVFFQIQSDGKKIGMFKRTPTEFGSTSP